MERVQCVVVGAGVVGLALARQLAITGREVVVLEAEDRIGTGISSRNSEVIHAGIYYPAGSLKARLCVAGNRALYDYCAAHGVAHRRCGKLIVATDGDQVEDLQRLRARAEANGVLDLRWLSAEAAEELEPKLHCQAALLSPSTGIIDSHGLMRALCLEAESHGASLVLRSPVLGGRHTSAGLELRVGGAEPMTLLGQRVFNCAGLGALAFAHGVEGAHRETLPPLPRRAPRIGPAANTIPRPTDAVPPRAAVVLSSPRHGHRPHSRRRHHARPSRRRRSRVRPSAGRPRHWSPSRSTPYPGRH